MTSMPGLCLPLRAALALSLSLVCRGARWGRADAAGPSRGALRGGTEDEEPPRCSRSLMAEAPGSSLVAAVLACAAPIEKERLRGRVSGLSCRVEELKGEVCSMINQRYVEFLPSMQSAEELESQVEELSGKMDQLKTRIENEVQQDLNVAIAEFSELKQQLERDTLILSVLKQLMEFDTSLKQFNALLPQKKYVPAACHLNKARRSLKLMQSRQGFELKILKALGREMVIQTANMIYLLGQEWQQMAVWKLPLSKEIGSLESAMQTELRLCTALPEEDVATGPTVASVLQALAILGELRTKFKHFGQLLLKNILKPLISHPSLQPVLEERADAAITLRFESVGCDSGQPSPVEVFAKMKLVLEVLHKHLLDVPLDQCAEEENSRPILAEELGNVIWKEISDSLIQDCLVHSIPNSSSKLGQYIEVIKATEEFEKALKDMQFLKEDSTDLLTYAQNVNCHFANKKCQDVIVAARHLMTSEIHNTVKVTPDSSVILPKLPVPGAGDQTQVLPASRAAPDQVAHVENETRLSRHTFSFPACRISESVQKLMALAYQTLQEALVSTDQCYLELFYSVRNIFHLFCDVVPMYHKENLQKLPQLTAIHHNNCMYIAHHLLTLGHQFRGRLSDGMVTFVDLVPGFRRLGTQCFMAQMRVQKGELLERLTSARNFSNVDDEDNYSAANKAVRQVLHQLKRLGKVWQDVLPVHVYCKAMGVLLNTALVEIINRITALEDISAENADRLHVLCQTMVDEGPLVFTPLPEEKQNKRFQEEVPVYVPKWATFKELMLVLQASLQDILDRWADSKGPLAAEFSPSEVRNLIRALFQNTERRAAALAKIK
ncbi:centromere/kinetochore protein zw10 homolog [Hemicordylus capensis]|uniref:centromere/kinetochore protein zw10 homolog n=1 Tax=Hemicordylus capensis TaxID=884348 RepID=UPI00230325A2|nr:centromere/kinetochore protein zw10 homolog [Hemicordylus capensis]